MTISLETVIDFLAGNLSAEEAARVENLRATDPHVAGLFSGVTSALHKGIHDDPALAKQYQELTADAWEADAREDDTLEDDAWSVDEVADASTKTGPSATVTASGHTARWSCQADYTPTAAMKTSNSESPDPPPSYPALRNNDCDCSRFVFRMRYHQTRLRLGLAVVRFFSGSKLPLATITVSGVLAGEYWSKRIEFREIPGMENLKGVVHAEVEPITADSLSDADCTARLNLDIVGEHANKHPGPVKKVLDRFLGREGEEH